MGRIATLMLRIRDSLSDPNANRWSNDRLLRLIDEAQKVTARKAKLLRSRAEVAVISEIATYDLPSEASILTRVLASDAPSTATDTEISRQSVRLKSHQQMDEIDPDWESQTGDGIEYIVFDKLNPQQFKVYPIPIDSDSVSEHTFTSDYGELTDSTGDTVDPYGVVTDLTTTDILVTTFTSDLGIVTDMSSLITSLVVYYLHRPPTLDDYTKIDVEQPLVISEDWDNALKHYVVGMCLRDDKDTQNRTVGNEELGFYVDELTEAMGDSSKDFTSSTQHEPVYTPGI